MNSKPNIILIISFILVYAVSLVAFAIDETMCAFLIVFVGGILMVLLNYSRGNE